MLAESRTANPAAVILAARVSDDDNGATTE